MLTTTPASSLIYYYQHCPYHSPSPIPYELLKYPREDLIGCPNGDVVQGVEFCRAEEIPPLATSRERELRKLLSAIYPNVDRILIVPLK
ncbi:hypothetical protein CDAR_293501 [Caerostris darwini]|uniref:Uncharacterized protein n=1 Tax=Caerostris darwini TaxID=1538125 RepID=A0AAV4RKD4_9ARAC|nr:hypothetical protein CDAR_293501 [Caerostris darwini]